jgi:hypothetical protein
MTACRLPFEAEEGQSLRLEFDGENLDPEQYVRDTELSDMDRINVYVR